MECVAKVISILKECNRKPLKQHYILLSNLAKHKHDFIENSAKNTSGHVNHMKKERWIQRIAIKDYNNKN